MSDICPTPISPSSGGLYWSTLANGECQWEKVADTDLTRYSIVDQTANAVIAKGTTQGKSIPFSSFSTHTYQCTLSFINSCGESTTFQVNSSVVIRPTPTDKPSTLSGTLVPISPSGISLSLTPSPSISVTPKPTIRRVATLMPTITTTQSSSSNSGSIILLVVLVFVVLFLGGLIFLLKRQGGGPSSPAEKKGGKNPVDVSDASGVYYVKPYKLEEDGKSLWLILSQGENQILGLYSGSAISEGKASIKGKYEEADGVKFIEIESLTPQN